MKDIINKIKSDFLQANQGLKHAFETTPDDRINWSPSPTARTPVELVAHIAMVTSFFITVMNGAEFDAESTQTADSSLRESEKAFKTRPEVLEIVEKSSREFNAFADALTLEKYNGVVQTKFFTMPASAIIAMIVGHISSHCAQIAYIQTIYGDRDWHMS